MSNPNTRICQAQCPEIIAAREGVSGWTEVTALDYPNMFRESMLALERSLAASRDCPGPVEKRVLSVTWSPGLLARILQKVDVTESVRYECPMKQYLHESLDQREQRA